MNLSLVRGSTDTVHVHEWGRYTLCSRFLGGAVRGARHAKTVTCGDCVAALRKQIREIEELLPKETR